MTRYSYTGARLTGETITSECDALDESVLQDQLEAQGILLIESHPKTINRTAAFRSANVSRREVANFTRQVAAMTRAGMRIGTIFQVLLRQKHSQEWGRVLQDLSAKIQEGMSLSAALGCHPDAFSQFYVSLVRAGETSGNLAPVLNRLSRFLENSNKLRRRVKSALVYPFVVLCVSAIVLFILLVYIVPVFKEMFLSFRTELPFLTKAVLSASDFVSGNLVAVLLALPLLGAAGWYLSRMSRLQLLTSKVLLSVPGLRSLLVKTELANFSRTMSTLLDGGVALNIALSQAAATVGNARLRIEFGSAGEVIRQGTPLNKAWSASKLIPPMVTEIIAVGEETGHLSEMFAAIADFYAEEVEATLPAVTSLLEPLLIVIVGLLVAAILIAMYLPLFEIIGQLG